MKVKYMLYDTSTEWNITFKYYVALIHRNVKRYLLGSGERLFVDVVVTNEGEDAFESVFDMKIPAGINYVNIERVDNERDVLVQCSAPSFINNNTLHCDIGNPLPKEKTVSTQVPHKSWVRIKSEHH